MKEKTIIVISKGIILNLIAAIIIIPFILLVFTAFKTNADIFTQRFRLFPSYFRWMNFIEIMEQAPFGIYMVNTIIVVLGILIIQLILVIPSAYAFSRLNFPGRDLVFILFVVQIMLPLESIVVPNYLLIKNFGLLNTRTAMILPFIASGFGTFQLRQTFKQIPRALEDAAIIDGCGHLRLIRHVIVPLSRPTIITFSLISIATHWNDYFWPLLVTESDKVRTLTIGLGMFVQQESGADWGRLMAATLFVSAPIIIFFLIVSRQFVSSFLTSGIKG